MKHLLVFLKGLVIGVANIIPGVSGGTMALVLGIYERILRAIGQIDGRTLRALLRLATFKGSARAELKAELRRIDALFLALLGAGALAGIGALAKLMTFLLENHHDPTYGFFFGLVLVSAAVPWRLMRRKTLACWIAITAACVLVIALDSSLSSKEKISHAENKVAMKLLKGELGEARAAGDRQTIERLEVRLEELGASDEKNLGELALLVLAGAVAISAMILPGVSGSFILLLMGFYFEILAAITRLDVLTLGVFAIGLVVGLLVFTRFLNWLIARYHDPTMGFLLGLMLGSLWSIWPFKETALVGAGTSLEQVIYLQNRWPGALAAGAILTLAAAAAGAVIVLLFLRLEKES